MNALHVLALNRAKERQWILDWAPQHNGGLWVFTAILGDVQTRLEFYSENEINAFCLGLMVAP